MLRARALDTASRPAIGAIAIAAYVLAVEWVRSYQVRADVGPALIVGGIALGAAAAGRPLSSLGIGRARLGLRILGGFALAAVLLLPAAVRAGAPVLPPALAVAAIAISVGEELAFRGALYAALEKLGGAPVAIFGSTAVWTAAHALSHPPEFLGPVALAGLLLALWRWACRDLVGPIVAHVIADLLL